MSQYPAVIELSSLDGTNGFRIDGGASDSASGESVSSAGDVNGDGFADVIIGAIGGGRHGEGASYVLFGMARGFSATLDLSNLRGANGFKIDGEHRDDGSGRSVSSAGDINADGFDDILVGAPHADPNDTGSGASYVVFGTDSGFGKTQELSNLNGNNGFEIRGEAAGDGSGRSLSSAGDVNGDGFDDLIIGANEADPNGNFSGASYVVFGNVSGFGADLQLSSLNGDNGFKIDGEAAGDRSGYSVSAAGDMNGDGFSDLIVSAPYADKNGRDSGASYVVFGKASGFHVDLQLSNLNGNNGFKINGEHRNDCSGYSVSSAGDVNGDGFADVIIGARYADPNGTGSGASYVVFGKASGFHANLQLSNLNGNNGFKISGEMKYDYSGQSVSSAGDVNGDGFADLIVGAFNADPNGTYSGASYVVFGKASGFSAIVQLSNLNGNDGFKIDGETAGDDSGVSVSSAGDVNGDGFSDLIVGAPGADPNGYTSGSSYVIFGSKPDEAVTRIGTAIANTIHGGNFNDTLKGIGGADTLLGYSGDDTLIGGVGGDTLVGGKGGDSFVYNRAPDSSGRSFDVINGADFTEDNFRTVATVRGVDAVVHHGSLHNIHFDADLAAAVDRSHLGRHDAVIFTPDVGTFSGKTFLIVDVNDVKGYQAGEDLVIQLVHAQHLSDLGVEDFI